MCTHIGIDYGSKLAGTTAVCWQDNEHIFIESSAKKKDADLFIQHMISIHNPKMICIDCPLSIPAAFFGKGEDFFYRICDKELNAMSPMFLGGLTARGIRLKYRNETITWQEVYPKALVETLGHQLQYNKKDKTLITGFSKLLLKSIPYKLESPCESWHEIDSLLAWISGYRFLNGKHQSYGSVSEGQIIV